MAIKKSEIYSQIWAACDKLRGGVEPARYKDYILTLLFVKYVSDRFKSSDSWDIEVPDGGSFDDIVALKYKKNIGEGINVIIGELAEANDLKGIIDIADFNSEELGTDKEAVDKLSGLVEIFQKPELDFTNNRAGGDDILGDAYEYLMRKFAQESGKSKGQFYTPGEVSRIMAKVIGIDKATDPSMTVYDPACGSGSLLIRAADEAPCEITIYGQEKDNSTAGLARMNLVLHNKGAGIIVGNKSTLSAPQYKDEHNPELLKTFNYIVVNPPFSDKSWMDGITIPDIYGRYSEAVLGVPPEKNGDYAWLLHVLKSLKSDGKAAIILPHGVLFRGNTEADIRKRIIDRGYIKGLIGLPANLFYGTGIPACILVIDKEDAAERTGIFMIDASRDYVKDGNKNRLREQDIHKIVTTFLAMDYSNPKYARFVLNDEIKVTNEYNLNIPRYIDSTEAEDLQDINAHLNGGIPEADVDSMAEYWREYPSLREILFQPLRQGYLHPVVQKGEVVSTITAHPEFIHHADQVDDAYSRWKEAVTPDLMKLDQGVQPQELIARISELLLSDFAQVPLLDKYDVYEVLMEYWAETMQDDVYAVCYNGYEAGREIAYEYVIKKKKENGQTIEVRTDKIKGFEGKLLPKALVAVHFFAEDVKAQEILRNELDKVSADLEEMAEENGGEDGLFAQLDDLKRATVAARIRAIKRDPVAKEALSVLQTYLSLMDVESNYKKALKQAETDLDERLKKKYPQLTLEEIRHLLVEESGLKSSSATLLPKGALLLCSRATIGEVRIAGNEICTNQGFKSLVAHESICNEWLYYMVHILRFKMMERAIGSTFLEISKKDLSELDIAVPTFPEQCAIAQVLSDMDDEIGQLEKKLAKCQQIKQGMIQELLTGRIRLVDEESHAQPKAQAVQGKRPQPAHNQYFDDAVMIAGIVNAFYSAKYLLGRKKVQKLLYLVRRKEQADTSAFHKKAAGPYADEVRYKGGEPIARKNQYIQVKRSDKGSCFERGVQMQKALAYLQDWDKQADIDWLVSQFQYTKVNELELLATVDMAICDLRSDGKEVSVSAIKDLIGSNKEWRDKLKKDYFKDTDIRRAIERCKKLFPDKEG